MKIMDIVKSAVIDKKQSNWGKDQGSTIACTSVKQYFVTEQPKQFTKIILKSKAIWIIFEWG
jgi:hypothetical protein